MPSQVTGRGPVKPRMNITPLIDVVFLLIIFFMIVSNIVTDENPEMLLPKLDDPKTFTAKGESKVTVNIVAKEEFEPKSDEQFGPEVEVEKSLDRSGEAGYVKVGSKRWDVSKPKEMDEFVKYLAKTIAGRLKSDGKAPLMLLRADAAINYSEVVGVLTYFQDAMIKGGLDPTKPRETAVHLVAYLPNE